MKPLGSIDHDKYKVNLAGLNEASDKKPVSRFRNLEPISKI